MSSVFHRLLNTEFGKDYYNQFFFSFQKRIIEKKVAAEKIADNKDVYEGIYHLLQEKDKSALVRMSKRLTDAMYSTLRISRSYLWSLIFYLAASLFLIALGLHGGVTVSGLVLISGCFLYKTYEFVVNKYCYIDAYIILVYKSVLDRVMSEQSIGEADGV